MQHETQDGIMEWLYSALQTLAVKIGKNSHDDRQMNQKFITTQLQMEGMSRVARVEFGKSINSVVRRFDARLDGEAKDRATSYHAWAKSEGKSKVPPCLSLGPDDRNLGVGTKAEQPPVAISEHKMDMGADSISAEKEKPTQQLKTAKIPDPWGANKWGRNDWRNSMAFNWNDPSGLGKYRPTLPPKGNYAKGGIHHQCGRT